AVISLGGIVAARSLRIAGDRLTEDIRHFSQEECKLLLGERTAEDLKMAIGSAAKGAKTIESSVRGRDLVTGLPREVIITDADVREAMAKSIRTIAEATKEVIERTPPELVADIMHRGIYLVGGGSFLRGLDKVLESETKIPIIVSDDPLTAVVRGCGIVLEDLDNFREALVEHEDELPPT
ncbi:MAG: Cell shape determining protein, MreB/Mrl family, partial [Candidatus Giovannonibacteria bacterium GW2011_GWC2_44_8]